MKKRTISTILILTMLLNFYSITTNALTTNPIIEDEFTITEIIEQNDNYEKIKVYDKKTCISQYDEILIYNNDELVETIELNLLVLNVILEQSIGMSYNVNK